MKEEEEDNFNFTLKGVKDGKMMEEEQKIYKKSKHWRGEMKRMEVK